MNILIIAPMTENHGQGKVSKYVYDYLKVSNNIKIIDTYTEGFFLLKLLKNISILFKILIFSFLYEFDKVYFTPSRNFQSSIRDFLTLFLHKKNIICHLHGSDLYDFLSINNIYCKALYNMYLVRKPLFIILSKSHSIYALGDNYNNYVIIPNFTSLKLPLSPKANDYYFISIVNAGKGLDKSIAYFQNVRTYGQKMIVVGWTYDDFINNHGISINTDNVVFYGPIYEASLLSSVLANCHTLIFLSNYVSEAQPLCVIEALINNRKVICSDFKMLVDFNDFKNTTIIDNKSQEVPNNSCLLASDFFNNDFFNEKLLNAFTKR